MEYNINNESLLEVNNSRQTMYYPDDLGNVYNSLCVIGDILYDNKVYYLCKCQCGNRKFILRDSIVNDELRDCGCGINNNEFTITLDISPSKKTLKRIRKIYNKMIQDASDMNLKVTKEWTGKHGFENFYKWALFKGYQRGDQLIRTNPKRGYIISNCKLGNKYYFKRGKIRPGENLPETRIINNELFKRYYYKGWKTRYLVSASGKVFSEFVESYIKPKNDKYGYPKISIRVDDRPNSHHICIHRMVGSLWVPGYEEGLQINHIDGNKENNNASNLEWVTNQENMIHSYKMGLEVAPRGENSYAAKYSDETIHSICRSAEGGIKVSDIVKRYGVGKDYIYDLLNGKSRSDITSQYNIPDDIYKFRYNPIADDDKTRILNLYDSGLKQAEIRKILGDRYTENQVNNMIFKYRKGGRAKTEEEMEHDRILKNKNKHRKSK